jgi:putative methyltransferase (TIGR04325 family)
MERLKRATKLMLPPIVIHAARAAVSALPAQAEWEHLSDGWPMEPPGASGWHHDSVVKAQLAKWTTFRHLVESSGPLGVAHEAAELTNRDAATHNTIMTFGYVLGLVARDSNSISVLDWGGGLGHYSLFARSLFPDLALDYHSVDLPSLSSAGAEMLPNVVFHSANSDCFTREYDLVMASTSLQYSQDWRHTLSRLAGAAKKYLYITGVPILTHAPTFPVIQRPHRYGYKTEYVGWFINRHELMTTISDENFELLREFLVGARPTVRGAPEQGEYQGFLFRHRAGEEGTVRAGGHEWSK